MAGRRIEALDKKKDGEVEPAPATFEAVNDDDVPF